MPKQLSVIIPTFNEETNIKNVVKKVSSVCPKYCSEYEIIIINDGSQDKTKQVVDSIAKKEKHVKVLHNKTNKGMGYCYLHGLQQARFEYIMINFGDDDHPAKSLEQVISKMGTADIIIPFYTNFHQTKTWFRHLLSISYTHLVNYITGLSIRYYNGITLHRTDLVRSTPSLSIGFGFQAEIIVHLVKKGANFVEVGIENEDDPQKGSSALRISNIIKVTQSLLRLYWFYG